MTLTAVVLALLSATLYGSADFLGGLASRRSSVMPVMIFSQLAGLAALLLVLPFLPAAAASRADAAWGAVAGAALGLGLMLLYQGLATGTMSVVAPVTALLAVVVATIVGMATGDQLSVRAVAGVALALTAITLISQDGTRGTATGAHGLAAALSAGVLIGLFFAALKQTSPESGLLPLVSTRLASLVVLAGIAISLRPSLGVGRDVTGLIIGGGVLDIAANVLYLLATRQGMLTVAATLTSLYPASTILLARVVLGERLRGIQLAGLACAAIGVALLGTG